MIGAYSAYAKFAVPMIEGPAGQIRRSVATIPATLPEKQDNKARLFQLLPNNAWELGQCKTLFTNSGTLLFQEMTRIDDQGTYTLTPFTMIMNDHQSGTAFAAKLDPTVPPTVLRCGEAKLKFDGPITITGNSGIQMRSASLNGEVTIFRPSASNEKDETLKLITQNVQINTERILTFSDVAFAFGPHKGSGKNLSIDLTHHAQSDQKIKKDFSSIEGISRIELTKLDRLLLDPSVLGDDNSPRTVKPPFMFDTASAPLEITCSGPFVFDYDKRAATFQQKVYGKQLDEFGDNLSCETLTVAFGQRAQRDSPKNESNRGNQANGVNIKHLSAIGTTDQPAVIIANSRRTKITGDELQFNSLNNEIIASSTDTVTIVGPEINVRARTIKYQLSADQSLGNLEAIGPGEFYRRSDDPRQNLFARWQRGLTIAPHADKQKRIIIDGAAEVLVQDDTQISSERISIALHEIKTATQYEYRPAEIVTEQTVTIISPNLDGVARKLIARWPTPVPSDGKNKLSQQEFKKQRSFVKQPSRQQPSRQKISQQNFPRRQRTDAHQVMRPQFPQAIVDQLQPQTQPRTKLRQISDSTARPNFAPLQLATYQQPAELATSSPPAHETKSLKQFIRFKTDAVELQLSQIGDNMQLADLRMDGNIVIHQLPEKGSDQPPLKVAGNRVRIVPQGEKTFRLLVAGTAEALATVVSQELALSGEDIHLDQSANKVWVAGTGVMNIKQSAGQRKNGDPMQLVSATSVPPQNQSNPVNLAPRGDIDVEFAGGMVFDGSKIYFERNVLMTAYGAPTGAQPSVTKTLSQALSVELSNRVDFSQLSSGRKIGDVEMNEMVLVNSITDTQRVFKDHVGQDDPRFNASDAPIIFQNEVFDRSGQLTQQRRFVVPRATINAATNTIYATGPGKIFTHQKGSQGVAGIGGLNRLGTQPNTQPDVANNKTEINYLQVNFDDRLIADLGQKQLNITGNIRTLFSPAPNFDFALDPDTHETLPAGAIKLKCENMQLSQWLPAGSAKPQNELIATGNTHVTSPTLESTADRISYNDGNDQMVVEGTTRSPANLWYRQTARGQRQFLTASKIIYHPSTGTAETQGVRNLNISIGK